MAILNYGRLSLKNSTVSDSTSSGAGGGIVSSDSSSLELIHSQVRDNTGSLGGGVLIAGTAIVIGSTFSGNETTSGDGGGIHNQGDTVLTNSTVSGNTALGSGGGIADARGVLRVTNSTFSGNTAKHGGAIVDSLATLILRTGDSVELRNGARVNAGRGAHSAPGGNARRCRLPW